MSMLSSVPAAIERPISYDDHRYTASIAESRLGFGETIDGATRIAPPMTTAQKTKLIGLIVLVGLTLTAAGALIGTGIGAGIVACVGYSLIFGMQIGAVTGAGLGLIAMTTIVCIIRSRANQAVPATNDFVFPDVTPRLGEFHENSAVLVSENGKKTAEWRDTLFQNAQQSIEWSGNFLGGKIFRKTLGLIKETMNAHPKLQVHILFSHDLLESEDLLMLEKLKTDYPTQFHVLISDTKLITNPELTGLENHVKMLVVDRKYFVTGGTGHHDVLSDEGDVNKKPLPDATFTSKGVGSGSRDMDVIGSGGTAMTMSQEFYKLWAIWQHRMTSKDVRSIVPYHNLYLPLPSDVPIAVVPSLDNHPRLVKNAQVKVLVCGGAHQPVNACTYELVRIINSAEKTIKLAQLCFNPTEEIFDALLNAANRGVQIELITNSLNKSSGAGMHFITPANRQQYLPLMMGRKIEKLGKKEDLFRASIKAVKMFEYNLDGILMHAKLVSVDGKICSLGSYNLGQRSHKSDYEMIVTMKIPETDATPSEAELKRSHEIDVKEAHESPVGQCDRIFESMKTKSKEMTFDEVYNFRAGVFNRLYGKFMKWYVVANFGG